MQVFLLDKRRRIFIEIELKLLYFLKDLRAHAGRVKIEQQKQTQLANIQKNKEAVMSKLTTKYATANKAKASFGYIGIIFLVVLFGSIFLNDFIKLCIYYFNGWREWRRGITNDQEREINENGQIEIEVDRVYGEDLEEKLERVYIKLVEANVENRRRVMNQIQA